MGRLAGGRVGECVRVGELVCGCAGVRVGVKVSGCAGVHRAC